MVNILADMELLTLPFLGHVTAGFPSPAGDYLHDRLSLDQTFIKHKHATFLFSVEGDSMIGAFIPDNSTVVVDRLENARNGSIVLAVVDGEFTVKRYVKKGTQIMLVAENPRYKPIHITEGTAFEIWGVVTYIISNAKEV